MTFGNYIAHIFKVAKSFKKAASGELTMLEAGVEVIRVGRLSGKIAIAIDNLFGGAGQEFWGDLAYEFSHPVELDSVHGGLMTTKLALRREVRERLAEMTDDDRRTDGDAIARAVWSLPRVAESRTLLLFASMPEEVPTAEIHREARRRGIEVAYPRVLAERGDMTLHRVESESDLVVGGRYGIREPAAHCPVVPIHRIDAALIPGLAWDREGNRLGRGAGYYDRLLGNAEWRAFECGLFFSIQEVAAMPRDAWDRPLDAIVTEKEVVLFPD